VSTCARPEDRTYSWSFNGTSLRPGIEGSDTATITIGEVRQEDYGLYTCNVSNAIGYAIVTVDLFPQSECFCI
jgi:hypothetical protein